jgi:hypothetical protein
MKRIGHLQDVARKADGLVTSGSYGAGTIDDNRDSTNDVAIGLR